MQRDPEPLKLPFLNDWVVEPASKEDVVRFDVPLKVLPKHGVCLWWPSEGEECIHPDDLEIGKLMVPSTRVLTKGVCEDIEDVQNGYVEMRYGETKFRIKASLWLEIKSHGFLIGDQIEIKSRFGKNQQMVAEIAEMNWDRKRKSIEYRMSRNGTLIGQRFFREDFRFSPRIGKYLDARELMLQQSDRVSFG